MSPSTPSNRGFLTGCHRASSLEDFGDTMSSSMTEDGARRLGAATYPSTACNDDGMSSSTTLVVFAGSVSSSMGWRRLFLLKVVKRRCTACWTTRYRRARFFVTSYALGFSPASLAPNVKSVSERLQRTSHIVRHNAGRALCHEVVQPRASQGLVAHVCGKKLAKVSQRETEYRNSAPGTSPAQRGAGNCLTP